MKNIVAALIISVGLVIYGILSRPVKEHKTVIHPYGWYRYQFIPNKYYGREKVFDRKTGVVYELGKTEDRNAMASDFKTGTIYSKDWDVRNWSKDLKFDRPEEMRELLPGIQIDKKFDAIEDESE